MAGDLPPQCNSTDQWLAALHDRLGELLDRLPPPPAPAPTAGQVELREPELPAAAPPPQARGRRPARQKPLKG